MTRYSERLQVPPVWYVLAAGAVLSVFTALVFFVRPAPAFLGALATTAGVAWLFVRSSLQVRVAEDGTLTVGRARLEPAWRGRVTVLDEDATRRRLHANADARAWLAVRGYVPTAVEIEITDPADPHPYWLVSTRRPRRLREALTGTDAAAPVHDKPVHDKHVHDEGAGGA